MIGAKQSQLQSRAATIAAGFSGEVVESVASIGGGSMPGETLPSAAISLSTDDPDALAGRLRTGTPRVFPIIRDGAVLIDVRTVLPRQDASLAAAIHAASS
jgi:L-seryl-tRNA(Ser) seleniumtransferase